MFLLPFPLFLLLAIEHILAEVFDVLLLLFHGFRFKFFFVIRLNVLGKIDEFVWVCFFGDP